MALVNFKKLKETTRDRLLTWIDYYSSKNFGIWIECVKCKKWRKCFQHNESHEVPEGWCCSMLTFENGQKASCDDPEEDTDEEYLEYCPGSIVWAKLEGYPWWPGMVDENPDVEEYFWREQGILTYNITFLDDRPTHAWIPAIFICPFEKPPKIKKGPKRNNYTDAIRKAKERAEAAMQMTLKDRLKKFSFVHLYKGRWPLADNFEDNIIDEDLTDSLLKEVDDLDSCFSTDTDDGTATSKHTDITDTTQEKFNTKYLSNKDFISREKAVFPLVKQNKPNIKTAKSYTEKSRIALQKTKNTVFRPTSELEGQGLKRSKNRKVTAKKVKGFVNPGDMSVLSNTDVEYVNDESEPEKTLKSSSGQDEKGLLQNESVNRDTSENDSGKNAISDGDLHAEEKHLRMDNEKDSSSTNNQNDISAVMLTSPEKTKQLNNDLLILKRNDDNSLLVSSDKKTLQHIDESIEEVIRQKSNDNVTITKKFCKIAKSTAGKNANDTKLKENAFPTNNKKNHNVALKNCAQDTDKSTLTADISKGNEKCKPILETSGKNHKLPPKMKPAFKLPIKSDKLIPHAGTEKSKITIQKENKQEFDIKQEVHPNPGKISNIKIIVNEKQFKNERNEDESVIRGEPMKSSPLKHPVIKCKEKNSEIITIDDKDDGDSVYPDETTTANVNSDEGFFYVSVSDDE